METHTDIVVRVIAGPDELSHVLRLRHEAYVRKGYLSPCASGMMGDAWDELSVTTHFVAVVNGEITGAVRFILDSPTGLPMERVFPGEIASLRAQRRYLAEASTLTAADDGQPAARQIWLALCRAVWSQAEKERVDDLCISVTPNHLGFYRRLLFQPLGPAGRYQALNGIRAWPLRLAVKQARAACGSPDCPRALALRQLLLQRRDAGCRLLRLAGDNPAVGATGNG